MECHYPSPGFFPINGLNFAMFIKRILSYPGGSATSGSERGPENRGESLKIRSKNLSVHSKFKPKNHKNLISHVPFSQREISNTFALTQFFKVPIYRRQEILLRNFLEKIVIYIHSFLCLKSIEILQSFGNINGTYFNNFEFVICFI